MIGMDVDLVGIRTDDSEQTLAHGHRTGVGIGHAENILRKCIRFQQDFPNPDGQDLGFPRSGSGYHHYWSFDGINRLFLSSIEFGVFVLVG